MTEMLPFDVAVPFRTHLDAMPSIVFAVDDDMRIRDYNKAARALLEPSPELSLHRLCGEVLHCIHEGAGPQACGRTEFCGDCVLRNAVTSAAASAQTQRQEARLIIRTAEGTRHAYFLVTAVPLTIECDSLFLLILEDATELIHLRKLLPICSHCSKIRNDKQLWQDVTAYLKQHEASRLTHSLCPDCIRELYPEEADRIIEQLNPPDGGYPRVIHNDRTRKR